MASWRPLGTSWAAVGRKMPRPLWKHSWAALGAVLAALGPLLAPLWAVLALPGGPREAPGGSGEGLREAISVLFWMVQREKLKKRLGKLFGQGFGCDSRLLFACLARARQGR